MSTRVLRIGGLSLILAGLSAVGYGVNEVWITDIRAEHAQEQLAAEFDQNLATANTTTLAIAAQDDPTVGSTSSPTTVPAERPGIITETAPALGEPLAKLYIPVAGVNGIMVEGVETDQLALGPGHMPGTALPGQPGNAVISGHRTTHGAPFRNIDKLAPGDRISVETLIGLHMYEVVQVLIVAPDALWVTNQVDGAWLTLTTCNPPGSARERLIVFAKLIWGPNYQVISHTLIGDEAPPRAPVG